VSFRTRNNEYSVKTSLILPGATLVASDHDPMALAAAERCVDNLMRKLKDYKDRLGNVPERQKTEKGTRRELQPSADPDPAAVEELLRHPEELESVSLARTLQGVAPTREEK